MGQWFYFKNTTLNVSNKHALRGNDITWISNLHHFDNDEIIEEFKTVIELNGWNLTDKIIASGDSDDYIIFKEGILTLYSHV